MKRAKNILKGESKEEFYERFGAEADEDDDGAPAKRKRSGGSNANLKPISFDSIVEQIEYGKNISREEAKNCPLCNDALFAGEPTQLHKEITIAIEKGIDILQRQVLVEALFRICEDDREKGANENEGVYERENWSRDIIDEHVFFHLHDPRIERRAQIDTLKNFTCYVKDNLASKDETTGETKIDDKNFKILIQAFDYMKKIMPEESRFTPAAAKIKTGTT